MTDKQSLTMAELIDAIGERVKLSMHTSMPAQVISYDSGRNTVEVQPVLKRKREDGESYSIAPIVEVPVCFYRAGGYAVTVKPQAGDYCVLVFQERSIDLWKRTGGIVDPRKPRKFSLTDAVAVFGAWPFADALPDVKSGVDLRNEAGDTSFNLTDSTVTLQIGGTDIFTASTAGVSFSVPVDAPDVTASSTGATLATHVHPYDDNGTPKITGPAQ